MASEHAQSKNAKKVNIFRSDKNVLKLIAEMFIYLCEHSKIEKKKKTPLNLRLQRVMHGGLHLSTTARKVAHEQTY